MADDKTEKAKALKKAETSVEEEQTADASTKRKRRVLRPAAEPTTFREQSEKAQARSIKPRKRSKVLRVIGAPFRFIGRLFKPLGRFKFFRALGYVFAPPYLRNSVRELSRVTWPNARTTWQLTYAVIVFSFIFGIIVAGVDFGLDKLFRTFILKQ